MEQSVAIKYYSRNEIRKAILKYCNEREIAVKFGSFFGKRPMVIEYISDMNSIIKKKPTSFHCSEERWLNPMLLEDKNLSEGDRDNNRIGWDLILDLDGVDFEYAKIVGNLIIEYLSNLGVKNVSTKFSGNKGFHIGIPFEAFSKEIIGIGETRKLFPEIPRKIAIFLMEELKEKISSEILKYSGSIDSIAKKYGFSVDELKNDDIKSNNLNYLKLIEIDTILINSRHLFRMPFSLNEKSGLVSIPIQNSNIISFDKNLAKPENINPENFIEYEFLRYNPDFGKDADILLIKAYEKVSDEFLEKINEKIERQKIGEERGMIFDGKTIPKSFEIHGKINEKDFPKSIKYLLKANLNDGRKRALFVLLTFLYSVNYSPEIIEIMIFEWNTNLKTPLRENIVLGQLNWFKHSQKKISPPNFSNEEYYKSIGIPKDILNEDINKFKPIKIKNPLHYVYVLQKLKQKKMKKN